MTNIDLREALDEVARTAASDSNDEEFDALNAALDLALGLLGVERSPEEEPDGAPCCPDPGCSGSSCTFPGYARNH